MLPCRPFEERASSLYCEEIELAQIAEAVGTPCYVYSRQSIVENFRILRDAFRLIDPKICYAVKANSNLAVLRLLKEAGSSFDIVSGGELHRLLQIGVLPENIIYSGVGKTPTELETAVSQGIFALGVESVSELEELARIASGRRVRVSLRVNPDVDVDTHPHISTGLRRHKFGIDPEDIDAVRMILGRHPNLELIGVGSHIGSQILSPEPFIAAAEKVRESALQLRQEGHPVTHLDLGGGFGIPYRGESPLDLREIARGLERIQGDFRLIMEPGRFIVGPAGALLTRVLYRKNNHGREFVIVDAGMNDLIRPVLYNAHHEVRSAHSIPESIVADLVGPVCETADFFARERSLPAFQPGDLAVLMDAGAYGFVAASNYNSRPRPAEVLVEGSSFRIVRRRESYADLIAQEQ